MTMMGLDIEAIEHLDFSTPCDDEECDNVAEWSLRMPCCGHLWLLCNGHKERVENVVRGNSQWKFQCYACNHETLCGKLTLGFIRL